MIFLLYFLHVTLSEWGFGMVRETKYKKKYSALWLIPFRIRQSLRYKQMFVAANLQRGNSEYKPTTHLLSIQINTSKANLRFVFEKYGADVLDSPLQITRKFWKPSKIRDIVLTITKHNCIEVIQCLKSVLANMAPKLRLGPYGY